MSLVKLNKSKRRIARENYNITKGGNVTKDNRIISPAYEKKYAHKVLENYTVDKNGRLHDSKGYWANRKTKEKYDKLTEIAREKTTKKKDSEKVTTTRTTQKGHFMKSNYALTYECTCYIEQKSTTNDDEKTGQVASHYYTISTPRLLTYNEAITRHNHHFPFHDLLNIEHRSTKVLSFGD